MKSRSRRSRAVATLATAVVATALAAGCAGPQEGAGMPTESASSGVPESVGPLRADPSAPVGSAGRPVPPPLSASHPPGMRRPTGPPKTPSDLITGEWIVGTVTTDGSGPCYGLVTDDGQEYAMHSTAGMTLRRSTRIRVQVVPGAVRADCGPGQQVTLKKAEVIR